MTTDKVTSLHAYQQGKSEAAFENIKQYGDFEARLWRLLTMFMSTANPLRRDLVDFLRAVAWEIENNMGDGERFVADEP